MIPTRPTIPDVRKIALIRAGAIGDLLVTLPAIYAIRVAYPAAEIILLSDSVSIELAGYGRTPVNRCIELPPIKGILANGYLAWYECTEFLQQMKKERFDIVVNFQGRGITANPMINEFGAGHTVSFRDRNTEETDTCLNYYYFQPEQLRFIELVDKIGARPVMLEPKLRLLNTDKDLAEKILEKAGPPPYIILNPFSKDIRRTWPLHNYKPVVHELAELGYTIILTGSLSQKDELDLLAAECNQACYNAAGMITVPVLAALISKAALVIAPDTGPLHLARAVETPSVGIYWAPNLINWGPLTRDKHKPVISWQMKCPFCGIIPVDPYPYEPRDQCTHEVSFV
ncbi:MAG TPA: glycosyltransferase family 9 protein, partial [Chitinophagaceae bacterium]|nr:glycosyltransferase family 9 protein [Chitinophagaceae bacterium]